MDLETPRLSLRPFTPSDLEDLARTCALPDTRGFAWEGPKDRETVAGELRKWMESYERGFGNLAVVSRDSGELIGHVGISSKEGRALLSYTLRRDHWCMGLAPEACREVMRHAFEESEVEEIWTHTRAQNSAWRKMMERLGMTHRETYHDTVHYAATSESFAEAMLKLGRQTESSAEKR